MSGKITAIGAAVADTLVMLERYPRENSKAAAVKMMRLGGGPAGTGIVAASVSGAECSYIGCLSNDGDGAFLAEDFKKFGVSCDFIDFMDGRAFTSHVWLSAESNTRTVVYDRGTLPPLALDSRKLDEIRGSDMLMLDGNELDAAIIAAKEANSHSVKVMLDGDTLYPGLDELLPFVDLFAVSAFFAEKMTGERSLPNAAAQLFREYKPEAVIVTDGENGGIICDHDGTRNYRSYGVKVVDSNGAGDVFHGAFAASYVNGLDIDGCCKYASAAAAMKCRSLGSRESVPKKEDVYKFMEENK